MVVVQVGKSSKKWAGFTVPPPYDDFMMQGLRLAQRGRRLLQQTGVIGTQWGVRT